MELKFLGRGSAFNIKEGNTSAYFIENNKLFLIDCGENIFERIIQKNLLNNINSVFVFITHNHPDHIGSLGSLIFYCYYVLKRPLTIISHQNCTHIFELKQILKYQGCNEKLYDIKPTYILKNKYKSFDAVAYRKVKHSAEIDSYSLMFFTDEGFIYYTGDTCDENAIELAITTADFKALYVDSTSLDYEDNPHLYIGTLDYIVPSDSSIRNKIYCMHINDDKCIELAKEYGFNVVEI